MSTKRTWMTHYQRALRQPGYPVPRRAPTRPARPPRRRYRAIGEPVVAGPDRWYVAAFGERDDLRLYALPPAALREMFEEDREMWAAFIVAGPFPDETAAIEWIRAVLRLREGFRAGGHALAAAWATRESATEVTPAGLVVAGAYAVPASEEDAVADAMAEVWLHEADGARPDDPAVLFWRWWIGTSTAGFRSADWDAVAAAWNATWGPVLQVSWAEARDAAGVA